MGAPPLKPLGVEMKQKIHLEIRELKLSNNSIQLFILVAFMLFLNILTAPPLQVTGVFYPHSVFIIIRL